jgi:hypothetical protein
MMTGTLRVRRSRGALSGVLLILLGIWGALIPFVGPYFHYAYTPDRAWVSTSGRIWLEVLPGVVTLAGGLIVLTSRFRPSGLLGAWLAALAGAWFAVGSVLAGHWSGIPSAGSPTGGAHRVALEQIGFFTGLGIVIVFLAALALGRFSVVAAKDAAAATAAAQAAESDAAAAQAAAATAESRQQADAATADRRQPAAAGRRTGRATTMIRPVPVFRGRRRSADAADATADADAASAEANDAAAKAEQAREEAGQSS